MKKLIILTVIVFLLLPSVISFAEEGDSLGDSLIEVTEVIPEADEVAAADAEEAVVPVIETEDAIIASIADIAEAAQRGLSLLQRLGIALAIIVVQAIFIRIVWFIFKKLDYKLEHASRERIKPLVIKKLKLLTTKQIVKIIEIFLRVIKYAITALQLFITLPIVFSLFEATRNLAAILFGYILNPIKSIAISAIEYIPNLFMIAIIVLITHYVIKALKFFAVHIENEKLKIKGFYTEWAAPTYRILQVLLWAFAIAVIYPHLPGSDSSSFRGVSVFVGIIFSLGSSSAIGNLVAGLVITYMRPFKIGDRVLISEITGFVVEKNLMVVRLKTHKNEYVTFPNLTILGSSIVNYNTSSDEDEEGLIIYSEVTFGYSVPWEKVHEVLIDAALKTGHVQKTPKPFVLQTKLDDFYAVYQINCYTKDVGRVPRIRTELYENIQDGFREAGIDMTSAHYETTLEK